MALHHSEADIDSCLAYEVLRNPDKWIGGASTVYLSSFLAGAMMRNRGYPPVFPCWKINGVLADRKFYQQIVHETGKPDLSINWVAGIDLSYFSFAEGFEKLKNKALAWHRENGVYLIDYEKNIQANKHNKKTGEYDEDSIVVISHWDCLVRLPHAWMGGNTGWHLFCFLNGMIAGGDWLGLPDYPLFREVFNQIKSRSKECYGSEFGAFRLYDSKRLLEWVDVDEKAFE